MKSALRMLLVMGAIFAALIFFSNRAEKRDAARRSPSASQKMSNAARDAALKEGKKQAVDWAAKQLKSAKELFTPKADTTATAQSPTSADQSTSTPDAQTAENTLPPTRSPVLSAEDLAWNSQCREKIFGLRQDSLQVCAELTTLKREAKEIWEAHKKWKKTLDSLQTIRGRGKKIQNELSEARVNSQSSETRFRSYRDLISPKMTEIASINLELEYWRGEIRRPE